MTSRESPKCFITSVLGNEQRLDGGAMFGNAPKAVWNKWLQADAANRIPLACRAMLVEVGGQRILCEAGIGAFFEPKLAERFGVTSAEHALLRSLNSLGLSDADIDAVILSHLHFDHAGGLLPAFTTGKKDILFPRARFIVGKEAFARAQAPHPRDRASFIPGLAEQLENSGRLTLVDAEHVADFMPDIFSFRFTNGHTPGQMHTVVHGNKRKMVFAGDLIPGRAWVHEPITMGYDRFAELIIDEKHELYEKVVPERWLVFYTHDPEVAASSVVRNDKGQYTPTEEMAELRRFEL